MSSYGRIKGARTAFLVPQLKTASLVQATPTQNQWYTVATLSNVEVFPANLQVATTGETLEVRATVEGVVSNSGSQVAVAGTQYTFHLGDSYDGGLWPAINTTSVKFGSEKFFARSFKLEIRKTTIAGAGTISASVAYQQY